MTKRTAIYEKSSAQNHTDIGAGGSHIESGHISLFTDFFPLLNTSKTEPLVVLLEAASLRHSPLSDSSHFSEAVIETFQSMSV